MTTRDLREVPEWRAFQRELALVRHLIGSGVTALGRANYAEGLGEYYTAFFGLSVGLERLLKLALVVDFALSNDGQMPGQDAVRKFGYRLLDLMNTVEKLASTREVRLCFQRPISEISRKIIACLDSFADARRGRYANFVEVGDPSLGFGSEPIGKWWTEVGEAILNQEYYDKRIELVTQSNARQAHRSLSEITDVYHIDECGKAISDVRSASIRTGQTEVVQKFGRYHTLTVVRWLVDLFSGLARLACNQNIDALFGAWEHLDCFVVNDKFLLSRKIWRLQ